MARNLDIYESLRLPLENESPHLRLLRLQDSHNGKDIECTLEVFPFDTCPKFTALSYCWGSKRWQKVFHVNGKEMKIRSNLWQFFQHNRTQEQRSHLEEFLWVDAICIDQNNVGERNHQVAMMGDIYSKASSTVSWLGPGTSDSDLAMETLLKFYCLAEPREVAQIEQLFISKFLSATERLYYNEYWTRLWVVQEIILAGVLIIQYGCFSIPCDGLFAFHKAFDTFIYKLGIPSEGDALMFTPMGLALDSVYSKGRNGSLLNIDLESDLAWTLTLHCADSRDRIFGLRALVKLFAGIAVDYNVSNITLYSLLLTLDDFPRSDSKDHIDCAFFAALALNLSPRDPHVLYEIRKLFPHLCVSYSRSIPTNEHHAVLSILRSIRIPAGRWFHRPRTLKEIKLVGRRNFWRVLDTPDWSGNKAVICLGPITSLDFLLRKYLSRKYRHVDFRSPVTPQDKAFLNNADP